jgi:hypothetical protein
MRSMMLSFILCALFVPVCAPRRWRMYDRTRAGGRNSERREWHGHVASPSRCSRCSLCLTYL